MLMVGKTRMQRHDENRGASRPPPTRPAARARAPRATGRQPIRRCTGPIIDINIRGPYKPHHKQQKSKSDCILQ
eukprot:scaffold271562_cov28-Tisochrysis_lutea.AAC.1